MTLANFAAAFCALATAVHLVTIAIAAWRCRPAHRASPSGELPPISLLRPVCGVEPFGLETLGSSFRLAYPVYEIIFCVARADDPVVPLVQQLIDDHPQAQARLQIGEQLLSPNPKLNNLVQGWNAARHPWIAMVDSNIVLAPDSLHRLLARWRDDTGAVSSMPIGSRPATFWAELECAFLNTLQARAQFVMEALGFGFAQGKTILLRRDLIERAGGLRALAADLAEDAATTKIVRAAGLRVRLVDEAFEQPLGQRGAGEVWARQLRWARLRRHSFPSLFLPEILGGYALPGLTLAFAAAQHGFGIVGPVAALLLLWVGAEALLAWCAGWRLSPRMVGALLVRDLLLPVLWIAACAGNTFVWRGTAMQARPERSMRHFSGFGRRVLLPWRMGLKTVPAKR
jgi:ceramide glucosyltransferase